MRRPHTPFSIILIFVIVFAVMVSASPLAAPSDPMDPLLQETLPPSTQESTSSVETTAPSESEPAPSETVSIPTTTTPSGFDFSAINATSAFIYDCRTDRLQSNVQDLNAKLYPASITKLFSMYVAMQYLDSGAEVTVGSILKTVPADSSTALLSIGNRLTVEALYYGMLLPSGNDAARVIAVAAGKVIDGTTNKSETDYMSIFVEEMNRQAAYVGFVNSHFVTPDGYHDEDHYMCLADMVTLGKLCIDNPVIMRISSTAIYTAKVSGKPDGLLWLNSNKMLHPKRYTPSYYCAAALGLKTGYTDDAGSCLLAAFSVEDGCVLIGVFGGKERDDRYIDAMTIFENFQKS